MTFLLHPISAVVDFLQFNKEIFLKFRVSGLKELNSKLETRERLYTNELRAFFKRLNYFKNIFSKVHYILCKMPIPIEIRRIS